MRFTLVIPDPLTRIDTADELNTGFSRQGVTALLDGLHVAHDWPYEILENLPQTALDRLYHDEAEPAARSAEVLIDEGFGFDGTSASRFGTAVPALIAYTLDGKPFAVYPNRAPQSNQARPIVAYLTALLDDEPS
jgi:hypothetical protein